LPRTLSPLELARRTIDLIAARGAANVVLLDLRGLTVIADYFVISSAQSTPQMRAIRDTLDRELTAETGVCPRFEGEFSDGWMLADLGAVIVHVFSDEGRAHYRLEHLWADAPIVLHVQ